MYSSYILCSILLGVQAQWHIPLGSTLRQLWLVPLCLSPLSWIELIFASLKRQHLRLKLFSGKMNNNTSVTFHCKRFSCSTVLIFVTAEPRFVTLVFHVCLSFMQNLFWMVWWIDRKTDRKEERKEGWRMDGKVRLKIYLTRVFDRKWTVMMPVCSLFRFVMTTKGSTLALWISPSCPKQKGTTTCRCPVKHLSKAGQFAI